MNDSTVRVRAALTRIAAGYLDDDVDPAVLEAIWRGGGRRRWRARAGVAATLGVVALLVAAALVPVGTPAPTVPATPPGTPLTSYPEHVAMPIRSHVTSAPGPAALAIAANVQGRAGVYAVGPQGAVSWVPLDEKAESVLPQVAPPGAVALSPDGHRLATASSLVDLTTGGRVRFDLDRSQDPVLGWRDTPWWSPDSQRVLYPAAPSVAGAEGLVVDVRGRTQEVPPAGVGDALLLAGWADADTVLGLWRRSADEFTVLSWRLGDPRWTDGPTVSWPGWQDDPDAAAAVSPDGSRILLLRRVETSDPGGGSGTEAQVFDTSTGALVGFPVGDVPASAAGWTEGSFLTWDGFGCRPAWRGDVPVITDDRVRLANGPGGTQLVGISSAFGRGTCPAFAGNELQGRPVPNLGAVWLERLRTWGMPLALLALAGLLVWWYGRRQSWREHPKPLPAIFPTFGR